MHLKPLALLLPVFVSQAHSRLIVTKYGAKNCGLQLFGSTNIPPHESRNVDTTMNMNGSIKIQTFEDTPCAKANAVFYTKTQCASTETPALKANYTLTNDQVCVGLLAAGNTTCVKVSCALYKS